MKMGYAFRKSCDDNCEEATEKTTKLSCNAVGEKYRCICREIDCCDFDEHEIPFV